MSDLSELYQELIIDHKRSPRNRGVPDGANHSAEGYNPFCGDKVVVHLKLEDDVIQDVGFVGEGCAISTASTSLMTETVKGRSLEEVESLFSSFRRMLADEASEDDLDRLGDLEALAGVRAYPARIKCANLSWHTLHAAMSEDSQRVSTE